MKPTNLAAKETFQNRDLKFPVETFVNELNHDESLFMHWHPDLEISYKLEGSATYIINGYPEHVKAGDLIIINPKQVHQATITSDVPLKSEVLIMNYNFIKSQMMDVVNEEIVLPLIKTKYLFHNVVRDKEVIDIFHKIRRQIIDKTPRYQLRVKVLMLELIDMLFNKGFYYVNKAYKRKNELDSNDATRLTIEYIHSNFNTHISLDQISDSVKVSKFHLCKLFKTTTGVTINTYINNYRISQAVQLMKDTTKNITEIALDVGYNNPSYFIKKFKEVYGVTPNQYNVK